MKQNSKFLLVFLAPGLLFACARAPQQLVSEKPATPIVDLASKKIRDSIVVIESENGSGTGFFVVPDKIATNIHGVAHPGTISVKSPDEERKWTIEGVVGFDAENGLVILKLTGEGKPLPLDDRFEIGEPVSIPGYRDGEFKVVEGKIQSIGKNNKWLRIKATKETDGSPVLNNNGQVIGVIVPYGSYAVPSSTLAALLDASIPIAPLSEWQQREQVRAAAYYSFGIEKSDAKDYAGAIVDFDKAIELNPAYVLAYNDRGSTKANLGDYTDAIVDLDKAIELDAQHVYAYSNRGGIKFILGESEEANGNVEKAQSLYEAAIADCDKAIQIDPEYANTYNFRAAAKLALGDFEGAVFDLNRAIEIDPEDADVYNNRGHVKFRLGNSEAARGNTKEAQRFYEAAIKDVTQAIKVDPEDADTYNNRGLAKTAFGELEATRGNVEKTETLYEAAIADYTQAIELNPKHADAYENLATMKCKIGDIKSARGDAEVARKLYHEGVTDYDKSIQLNNPEDVGPKAADLEFKKVEDSTVLVIGWIETLDSFFGGSGFFVDEDRIATNIHVVAQPGSVFVKLRDKEKICAVEGVTAFDVENDLVILKIAGEGIPLSVGDNEAIQSGEPVVVVGYPNKKYRVIKGTIRGASNGDEWLWMTPYIGSGGSGSPMLNSNSGQVVGINAAGGEDYGYAIPSSILKALLEQSETTEPLAKWQKREFIHAYALFVQGQMKYNANHYHEAIADFDAAIEINAQFFYSYYKRGDAKFALGNYEAAIADYDKAMKIKGGVFNIYFDRGLAKFKLGDNEAAIVDYDKAIAMDPEHANAYRQRGKAKISLRDFDGAMLDFNSAIQIDPEHADAYKKRAHTKFKIAETKTAQGDITGTLQLYQSAMEDCTQAIRLTPKDADAYDNRGWARFHLGKSEAARGNMKKAADLYQKAIEDYTQAIKINPEHPYAYRNRDKAKSKLGDYEEAIVD